MAHLWVRDAEDWAVLPVEDRMLGLSSNPPRVLENGLDEAGLASEVVLLPIREAEREQFVLLTGRSGRETRVNGLPLSLGIRILADRDEIRIEGAGTVFLSTERLARIEPLPEGGPPKHCPRCHLPIQVGTLAVQCPGCSLWYHQQGEYPCWAYKGQPCGRCASPTELDAGFRWTPEDL